MPKTNNNSNKGRITPNDGLITSKEKKEIDNKLKQNNLILLSVVVILLVMVATLIIDSFHVNSAIYKEYSEKIQTLNSLNQTNNELMSQNKKNQELILNQQNQLTDLINKLSKK